MTKSPMLCRIFCMSLLLVAARTEAQLAYGASVLITPLKGRITTKYESSPAFQVLARDQVFDDNFTIQTDTTGIAKLAFGEKSSVTIHAASEIMITSLKDTLNQPLISIELKIGKIGIKTLATKSYRSFNVSTDTVWFSVDEQATEFTVWRSKNLTTIAVRAGTILVQPTNAALRSIYANAGEQISLNAQTMGPKVVAFSPPTLTEPKEHFHRLLELGPLGVCETGEQKMCATWSFDRTKQQFTATWPNGSISVVTIQKMKHGEIELFRKDIGGPSKGLTATYRAKDFKTEIEGDVAVQIIAGSVMWKSNGTVKKGVWQSRSNYFIDFGR